jgi:hypothetical protein
MTYVSKALFFAVRISVFLPFLWKYTWYFHLNKMIQYLHIAMKCFVSELEIPNYFLGIK